jgi:hypothetical protein
MSYKIKSKSSFEIIPPKHFWVNVDFGDVKSIKEAEKLKEDAERCGYRLKKTEQTGLNKFRLIYIRN